MASSSARASRASCFFCPENVKSILGWLAPRAARSRRLPDLARQRAQVRALERGPGALVTAQRGDQRGLLGGPRVRVDANPEAALDGLPRLHGGGHDPLGRPAANPRDPPEPVRPGREDLADRLQARVNQRGERDLLGRPGPEAGRPASRQARRRRAGRAPPRTLVARPRGPPPARPGPPRWRRGPRGRRRRRPGPPSPGEAARLRGTRPQPSPVPGRCQFCLVRHVRESLRIRTGDRMVTSIEDIADMPVISRDFAARASTTGSHAERSGAMAGTRC